MMSVGLHSRLVGRPGRLAGLARFLDHVANHDRVWICRRLDIARHWPADAPVPRQLTLLSTSSDFKRHRQRPGNLTLFDAFSHNRRACRVHLG